MLIRIPCNRAQSIHRRQYDLRIAGPCMMMHHVHVSLQHNTVFYDSFPLDLPRLATTYLDSNKTNAHLGGSARQARAHVQRRLNSFLEGVTRELRELISIILAIAVPDSTFMSVEDAYHILVQVIMREAISQGCAKVADDTRPEAEVGQVHCPVKLILQAIRKVDTTEIEHEPTEEADGEPALQVRFGRRIGYGASTYASSKYDQIRRKRVGCAKGKNRCSSALNKCNIPRRSTYDMSRCSNGERRFTHQVRNDSQYLTRK